MEQNGKHIAEMQDLAATEAELIKRGAKQPAYARDIVMLCKGVTERGVSLDGAIAALNELAKTLETSQELHRQIRSQVDELFRAAMLHVIEQMPDLHIEHAVQTDTLFGADVTEKFALITTDCFLDTDGTFSIKGCVVGSEFAPHPYKDELIYFRASFSSDYDYDQYQEWSADAFENCFYSIDLDYLNRTPETLEKLRAIKAWLDSFVTMARLSQD